MSKSDRVRRINPFGRSLVTAALGSGVAVSVNIATSQPASKLAWLAVITLTGLVALTDWKTRGHQRRGTIDKKSQRKQPRQSKRASERRQEGNFKEAEEQLRALLLEQHSTLGDDHTDTLQTRHELATIMNDRGDLNDAENEYRSVLEARIRKLGKEHLDTLAMILRSYCGIAAT